MNEKKTGKTFNVTHGVKDASGKTTWTPYGRIFVLTDLSEGSLYVGRGDDQQKFALQPKEGTTKTGGKSFEVVNEEGELHARLFLRADFTGGALWVGQGDSEVQYSVFEAKGRPRPAAEKPAAAAAAR